MSGTTIHVLGTGTAFNDDGRRSAGLLFRPGVGGAFLVDAGPTLMVPLMHEQVGYADVDRLVLTHLHGDHVAGWPFLLLHLVVRQQRTRPFDVYGPIGTRRALEELAKLCYGEVFDLRRFELRFHELEVASRAGIDLGQGLSLDTIPVRHHASSIGLRFRLPGGRSRPRVVAVSGDTGWCDELEELAAAADLLVLECSSVEPAVDTHVSLEELRDGRPRLRADQVLLVHLTDEVARKLAIDPIPGVIAASDGLVWEIAG